MQAPQDHPVVTQPNPLKRKRELLPLGTPLSLNPSPLPSEQRSVLRANRACNTCRRQKMRCEGPDQVPCARCKNAGVECIFEKVPPNKGSTLSTPNRIAALERNMEAMQATQNQMHNSINEILRELRRRPANPDSPDPETKTSLDRWKTASHSPYLFEEDPVLSSPSSSLCTPPTTLEQAHHLSSVRYPSLPPIQSLLSQPYSTPAGYPFDSSPLPRIVQPPEDGDTLTPLHVAGPSLHSMSGQNLDGPSSHSGMWSSSVTPPGMESTRSPSDQSRISDILPSTKGELYDGKSGYLYASLGSMAGRETDRAMTESRRRLDARQVLREDSGSRVWNPDDHIKEFRAEDSTHTGAIERGLLAESDAQFLFDLFFKWSHPRMPIFDPKTDTFESLRQRSPFCFCCVLMVASKVRDGGNRPSAVQLALWDEAMKRAKESMFQRVKDLEVIQGLLLLSAWCESTGGTSWILAGHAIRCGVDLGIHKALGKLAAEPNIDEGAAHVLVCSTRVWCALFAFEYQLSFGIGRFIMTGNPKTVKNAREILLHHRFSNSSDMRLVSACEIMIIEFQILDSLPNADANDPRCQQLLQEGRARMDQWFSDWDALLSPAFPPEHYMRQTLAVHRCFGYIAVHMACVPRVLTSSDIDNLSDCERDLCLHVVSASRKIVEISVKQESYRDGLRYSPTCFYSGVSFVGALVLRLRHILPGEQEYNTFLVEQLAQVLEDVPTCRFKFSFVTLLKDLQSTRRVDKAGPITANLNTQDSESNSQDDRLSP